MTNAKTFLTAAVATSVIALGATLMMSGSISAQTPAPPAKAPAVTSGNTGSAGSGSGLIDASQPERILSVARGFGNAELEKDRQGDPRIRGRMEGKTYFVNFYGCRDGKNCRTIQFRAWFELKKKPTIEAANDYNMKYRFLKVYVDKDQDLAVEFDVNLDGGVTTRNLDDTFDWWKVTMKSVMRDFPE